MRTGIILFYYTSVFPDKPANEFNQLKTSENRGRTHVSRHSYPAENQINTYVRVFTTFPGGSFVHYLCAYDTTVAVLSAPGSSSVLVFFFFHRSNKTPHIIITFPERMSREHVHVVFSPAPLFVPRRPRRTRAREIKKAKRIGTSNARMDGLFTSHKSR